MKHFSEEVWADFARDLVSPEARLEMQEHVDNGCKECHAALELWHSVVAISKQESVFTPPADVVKVAKSQFAVAMPHVSSGVRLVFDSMLQPMTAGVRGSVAARQFLYETDDFYIDLRLEPRPQEDRACVVGQVLSRTDKHAAEGVAVRVKEGKQPIAQTQTNRFGEFQLEFEVASGIYIAIARGQNDEIVLPIYGVHVKAKESKDLD